MSETDRAWPRGQREEPAATPAPDEAAREAILRKVRKLLAKAEDPGATPAEARAFTAKAQRLMTKYAIDAAMAADPGHEGRVVVGELEVSRPYASHKVALVAAVARANECRAVFTPLGNGSRRVHIVGFHGDVEWVRTLAVSLEVQLARALARATKKRPPGLHARTFAVGFVQGFIDEVDERLQHARRQAIELAERERRAPRSARTPGHTPSSVALVLVAKADRVEQEYTVRFPDTVTVRRYVRLKSWSGYEPGREAGRRASLLREKLASPRSLGRAGGAPESAEQVQKKGRA